MADERLIKEWSAMLTYVDGSYTGTIKSLATANNLDYNRCIRMNRALSKKNDKIAYARMMIEKCTLQNESFSQEVVGTELPEEEPVPETTEITEPVPETTETTEPVLAPPLANNTILSEENTEEVEYISKKEFQVYRENINATLESIMETQKYSETISNLLFFSVSIIGVLGYYLCLKTGIRIHL